VVFESGFTTLVENDTNGGEADIFLKDTQTDTTTLVSADSSGVQANEPCEEPSVSGDGRYVVFYSYTNTFSDNDTNETDDIFLKDTVTGTVTRISTDSSGVQANDSSFDATISADGRYVVFVSYATNLVTGDTNDESDIFMKDTITGETTIVSTNSSGEPGNDHSGNPAISSDGRYVVFDTYATNLVAGDTNDERDIFLKDTMTGETIRISTDKDGVEGNGYCRYSDISDDGRYVVFASDATNLVAGVTNDVRHIYLKDMDTGIVTRLSINTYGIQGNHSSDYPVISGDGNFIAFKSSASNLVLGDTGSYADIFRVVNPGETDPGDPTSVSPILLLLLLSD
jgi:Tol biopolymer transport system component